MFAQYEALNFSYWFSKAAYNGEKTTMKINGSFRVIMYNLYLYEGLHENSLNYTVISRDVNNEIVPYTDYTAKNNFPNFIVPNRYWSQSGTFSIHS
jgi:hypothetical protein